MDSSPFPMMDDWLKKWFKRNLKGEDAFLHYAYTHTIIIMLNESKLYKIIPNNMKIRIIKLIAIYITGSELIGLAIKNKEKKCNGDSKN